MTSQEVADHLNDVADFLEMADESTFRVRAYRRAAESVAGLGDQLALLATAGRLDEIAGVGKAIADTIHEVLTSGSSAVLTDIQRVIPASLRDVRRLPGMGPKLTVRMFRELGVTSVPELEAAIRDGRMAALANLGDKKAATILRAIETERQRDQRVPVGVALRLANEVIGTLQTRCPTLSQIMAAGSLRRFRDTIGDIDLIGVATDPAQVMQTLTTLPRVQDVLGNGMTKSSVLLAAGQGRTVQLDLRLVPADSYGSLLQHSTGSKGHNILLREYAQARGLSVNEYGITTTTDGTSHHCATEEDVYHTLGLDFIPPELREGTTEVALAARHQLPNLIALSDMRGDLHTHTDWSDGASTLEEMVAAARARGYSYLAIADHSAGLGVANGLSVERLHAQIARIRAFNAEQERHGDPFRLLAASEVDIRADGTLDYPDEALALLDFVVASIHSAMNQSRERMTERLLRAIAHPAVDVIGHLTARLVGHRSPVDYDRTAVFSAAAAAGVALEINASLERLDLCDTDAAYARDCGLLLTIDSDAHQTDGLDVMEYGVRVARRAWLEPWHVLNTRTLDDLRAWRAARLRIAQERVL